MSKFVAFGAIFLLIGVNIGNCLDFHVIGEAVITEANHDRDPNPSDENSDDANLIGGEVNFDTTTPPPPGGTTTVVGNLSEAGGDGSSPELPFPSETAQQLTTELPWLASIKHGKRQICTGTLIHKEYILTTAFCLYDLDPADLAELEVGIGFSAVPIVKSRQSELNQGPRVTSKVKRSLRHLRFSPSTGFNDIALLQLLTPVSLEQPGGVGLIQLENVTLLESDNQKQHIIGWRDGVDLNGETVQYWRDQISQGVSLETCRKGYEEDLSDGISSGMMCSGGDTDGTSCRWKFGTPLLVSADGNSSLTRNSLLKQVGIFSWGSEALLPECRFGPELPSPMVYTRVSAYFQWIQKLINVPWPLNQIQ